MKRLELQQWRAFALVATILCLPACYDVPSKYGEGLPSEEDTGVDTTDTGTENTDTPTDIDTDTNTETNTDTDSDTDTGKSNEQIDPDQWPNYIFRYGQIDGAEGKLDYHQWLYDGDAEATLLFVDGRTEYNDKYHYLVNMFDRPWNVIMWDHYGQGRSDGARAHVDDFDTVFVADMKTVIDELVADLNLPLVVLAHSMGSAIATRFAQLHPGVAEVYSLSAPGYEFNSGGLDPQILLNTANKMISEGRGEEHIRPQPEIPPCEENLLTHDCALFNAFNRDPIALTGDPTYGWLKAHYALIPLMEQDMDKITEKIFMMQAGDEQVAKNNVQDKMCKILNDAKPGYCTLQSYAYHWHELLRELDRDRIVEDALAFIDNALEQLDDTDTSSDTGGNQ